MNKSLVTNIFSIVLIAIGFVSPVFGEEIKTMGLFSFSGAITNWLAIHMLFEKVPGLYGSGIITERFEDFKSAIKTMMMEQFFTKENFEKFLSSNSSNLIQIEEDSIIQTIDFDKVFNKLKDAIMESQFGSMLAMFGGAAALEPLKPQFEIKFKEIIKEIIEDENFISNLTKSSEGNSSLADNVEGMVDGRLNELTPQMVKEIIQTMIREHLGWLVVWGGVFGAVLGLISTLL
ncbi:putative membrane protein [Halobacteriovorax marinus SJ]|uniref:Membrane protein n=1 Tax=Halobacteriovorax marinus (strain ATCC BAA-682 / DSM 15412 / SJ) TaxID=862908 RepID=E1WX76_HALMS|nr:hypothetical protein [Halobacteriovorax marinus]CBW25777.1 putative membrane protein [Halobacteriovorax marinus SJ]